MKTTVSSIDSDMATTAIHAAENGDDRMTLALKLSFSGMFVFLAIFCNLIVLVAYCGKWRKSPNLFLVTLAITDMYNCFVLCVDLMSKTDYINEEVLQFYGVLRQSLVYFGCANSSFLVGCIAVDRFMRIGRRLSARLSPKRCTLMCVCTFIVSAIVSAPFSVINLVVKTSARLDDGELYQKYVTRDQNENMTSVDTVLRSNVSWNLSGDSSHNQTYQSETHSLIPRTEYALIFHVIVALQVLMAFFFVLIIGIRLVYVVVRNGYKMTKHSQRGIETQHTEQAYSVTPSTSDISQQSHSSPPMDRTELKRKLSTLISNQAANLNRHTRRPSLSTTRHKTPTRTIVMLLIAALLFLLNIPPLCINILNFVMPSINTALRNESMELFDFLEHSYIFCFIGNPIVYAFFNRGFFSNLRHACCCNMKLCSLPKERSHRDGSIEQNGGVVHLNPRIWYPDCPVIQTENAGVQFENISELQTSDNQELQTRICMVQIEDTGLLTKDIQDKTRAYKPTSV